jgi:type VI secretion system FHA domain protein
MIVLRVLSYNGAPAAGPEAQFDELGGTIGRADNNQLVLPDPERTISRVHARVVFRAGQFAVVDNGSNPISVNGQPVGAGREQPLKPGDQIQIGGYVLMAQAAASKAAADPFADLFGDGAVGLAVPAPPPAMAPAAGGATAMPRAASAGYGAGPSPSPSPWGAASSPAASPWGAPAPSPAPSSWPAAAAPAASIKPGHIPEDWDPFAPDDAAPPPAPVPAGARAGDVLGSVPAGGGESLDELFGLSAPGPGLDPLADPLGAPPAQALLAQPNTGQGGDAYQSLLRTATLMPPPTAPDHASELNTPMPRPQPRAPAAPPTPAPLPAGAVFSWNDPPRDGRVVTLPGVRRSDASPAAANAGAAIEPMAGSVLQPAAPSSASSAATPFGPAIGAPFSPAAPLSDTAPAPRPAQTRAGAPASATSNEAELLGALLQGLGTPGLRLNQLDAPTMLLLGQLLRESMRGAVELLVARAALKREMRAEMTMIVARENNPLKFSPTVEVALQHLLGPPAPGFMPATAAVRDAFDDLRAHQLGVMAGMRAALEGVLGRFDPQQLEAKLTHRSAIGSLIPATRKARLWEAFQELFAQLQAEAQDDFDELFGKAFVKAYEDQLDRLQREGDGRG